MNDVHSAMPGATTTPANRAQRAELQKAARREAILQAARAVFARKGFHGTTIADIAEEAGIALGTFYLYFPSKNAIFAALHERLFELIARAAARGATAGASLREDVDARVSAVFETCRENRELLRLVVLNTDPTSPEAREMARAAHERERPLADLYRRAMAAGVVRKTDPEALAKLVTGLVSIAVYQCFVLDDGAEADRLKAGVVDFITAALEPR
jgi:AcrR family transcriptional regulator